MTKAKCRVPAISNSHKPPVTLSSPLRLKPTEKVGQAVSGSEAAWNPMVLQTPSGGASLLFSSRYVQWGWSFFNPLRKAMLARVPVTHGGSPGSVGWRAGGGGWTRDHPPPQAALKLWAAEMALPAPWGPACCCHWHGQHLPFPCKPTQSECTARHAFVFPLASGADFTFSPVKLHLAVTFLQQLKRNPPQPASLGTPGLC